MIDEEATRWLKTFLSARTIVDFTGPHGWEFSALSTGEIDIASKEIMPGVSWGRRTVHPVYEVRVSFALNQLELDEVSRGRKDPDLDPLEEATRKMAVFEDKLVYQGFPDAKGKGLMPSSPHKPLVLPKDMKEFPQAVAEGVGALHEAGIGGPYALALSHGLYHRLLKTTDAGRTVFRTVQDIVNGPVVWSPALEGGVMLSTRGGDYEMAVGQDLSIGYVSHDHEKVELYLTETVAFRVLEPRAAITLKEKK